MAVETMERGLISSSNLQHKDGLSFISFAIPQVCGNPTLPDLAQVFGLKKEIAIHLIHMIMSGHFCQSWIQRRDVCRQKHGMKSDRCWKDALEAKRCLSFAHCELEATRYYGTTNGGKKEMCGAFHESYCFGNPKLMKVDSDKESEEGTKQFEYHQKARSRILNNRQRFRDCQMISDKLEGCLRRKYVET